MQRGVCKNILYSHAMNLIQREPTIVIDVRDTVLPGQRQLPGSIHIPARELSQRIRSVAPDRNQPILVYCASGSHSVYACQVLADYGYQRVYNLAGGLRE